jgi:hypothetical protein
MGTYGAVPYKLVLTYELVVDASRTTVTAQKSGKNGVGRFTAQEAVFDYGVHGHWPW